MNELCDDTIALTVTSPPYWNAIDYDIHASDKTQHYRTRTYANGYSSYSDYLDWLERIFQEVHRVTKPGGFCAIVIGTVLLDGTLYPVPFDLISRLTRPGWQFHQDIVWHIAPVPPNFIDHPCPFPEEIPYRLITLYSYPGEVVLDPFVGSGQTTKVAKHLDRGFVGYDTVRKYVDLATARLDEPLSIRPQQLIVLFEKIGLNDPAGQR